MIYSLLSHILDTSLLLLRHLSYTHFKGNHGPSCFNLAVIFNKGDAGVPANPELFQKYKDRTEELVEIHGGLKSHKFA